MTTASVLTEGVRMRPPWRFGHPMPAWVGATFAALVLAVVATSFLSHRNLEQRSANAALTDHAIRTLNDLELVHGLLKDAETAERGYLLTGEDRYLEPYNEARAVLPTELVNLRQSMATAPQASRVALLETLIDEKMADLGRTIDLRRSGKVDEAVAIVRTDRGKATMDAVHDLVGQMEDEERRSLQNSRSDAAVGTLKQLNLIGATLLLLLISLSAYASARAFRDREIQSWIRAGHSMLGTRLQGAQRLDELGDRTISFLGEYLEARVGSVLAAESDGRFTRCGAYALPRGGDTNGSNGVAHGLVGQAAKDNRVLYLSDIPDDYLPVTSSLGSSKPRRVLLAPAAAEGKTNAVIELGFFREVGAPERELLERVGESVGLAFRAAKDRDRQASLLEETQRQAEELQVQQEELKSANEELEEQTERLKASQTELEETNAQLEEQTQTLESQKEALLATQRLLQQRTAEIERGSRYKSEFLANMSHELRTPLNSSLLLAKLLIDNRKGNLTPDQIKYAQSIYGAGNDLLALINDILDLAKIESGSVDLSIQPVMVARLFEKLRSRFEPLAADRKLELRMTIEPGCPETIESDPQRLQQVLVNLLSNAVKFTENGSVTLSAALIEPHRLAFSVQDTGIGIPAEQHEVIFEAFRQADGTTNRRHGGTGLGLSICRELVALLGGTIRVRSAPGEGSTFTVVTPLRSPSTKASRASNGRREPAALAAPAAQRVSDAPRPLVDDDRASVERGARVVLIVEDDPVFAEILRDLGRDLKFQCIVARDAAEGLSLAHRYRPVAVVLDVGLPDQSGLAVLELLKRDPSMRHVPIHVVSAHDYQKVARELGAVGYVLKPVKREQLVAAFRVLEDRLARKVKTVLVIEDDPVQRDAINQLLRADDVQVLAVRTAEEGLAHLRSATFDCCVLDLMLPGVSGFDLLERMSKDDASSFPPIIVYTARMLTADEEQRLRRSSSSIIIKGARSPERLLEEATLFLHQVESELSPERQRMLRVARDRERIFEGRRVLLVEDDVRNIFALSHVLEPRGLAVEIARNGKEALARMAETPAIDLVLMDTMMPEMDGLTATRAIRADGPCASVPIIALTAKAMPDDRQASLEAGASDYIAKPIDVEKLLSLLRVWMPK
jgi:CheY-like chemotaxis protein/CHASE3 domain sensor protein